MYVNLYYLYCLTIEQGSKFDQRAVPINRFLYSTTVQNFTHLSYSFRVTTPNIGAGRWHGPKIDEEQYYVYIISRYYNYNYNLR